MARVGGMFEGFEERLVDVAADVRIHCVVAGSGPPVLLLHGYPQSLALWGEVAPVLADRFTVVCADLRGYGDSSKPKGAPEDALSGSHAIVRLGVYGGAHTPKHPPRHGSKIIADLPISALATTSPVCTAQVRPREIRGLIFLARTMLVRPVAGTKRCRAIPISCRDP